MPTYDYVCTVCATRIEVMHGVSESGPQVCTDCGGAMRKALSPPTIVFKGSGWAKKDARSAEPATREGGDAGKNDESPKDESAKPADATAAGSQKGGSKNAASD